eukprot:CAMPEP_0172465092 /NCGR_PEP_ID=MMETSP1065-20121228/52441_1 /TAXON_ID=265537 /ORGANISM="Amphiprora paludosa, Strain CCMP125" /LENGTH=106 /DNA_ID=CAMNT_0013221519 /DNA_START=253 /DNA_END=573 /DNA_ORIENTATION=-
MSGSQILQDFHHPTGLHDFQGLGNGCGRLTALLFLFGQETNLQCVGAMCMNRLIHPTKICFRRNAPQVHGGIHMISTGHQTNGSRVIGNGTIHQKSSQRILGNGMG